jgi:WD40 repeat protein
MPLLPDNNDCDQTTSTSLAENTVKKISASSRSTRILISIPKKSQMKPPVQQKAGASCVIAEAPPRVSPTPRKKPVIAWPTESSNSLPPLPLQVVQGLRDGSLQFETSAEPSAIKLSPTGRLLAVAFNDGTLRLFDMTGRYNQDASSQSSSMSSSSSSQSSSGKTLRHSASFHPRYGVVAAQLLAKGVHSSLVMDVDVSPDAQWFFTGAARGSVELVAVHVGELEAALGRDDQPLPPNMMDLVTVYRHSDAKLRGFSACTRVQTSSSTQYLLLTGRGIKNCHVWRFVPPEGHDAKPLFHPLMEVPTNGSTIKFLQFRRQPHLQIVSKSDYMKVQLWDLKAPEAALATCSKRSQACYFPRPSYKDVPHTESALGVAGAFCLCGGSERFFNTVSVVNLHEPQNPATELELPNASTTGTRSRRGQLQSVESVATLSSDAGHALLELSDKELVQYCQGANWPTLRRLEGFGGKGMNTTAVRRKLELGRIGASGVAVAVEATFDSTVGRGSIRFLALDEGETRGFWGFLGQPLRLVKPVASSSPPDGTLLVTPSTVDYQQLPPQPHSLSLLARQLSSNASFVGRQAAGVDPNWSAGIKRCLPPIWNELAVKKKKMTAGNSESHTAKSSHSSLESHETVHTSPPARKEQTTTTLTKTFAGTSRPDSYDLEGKATTNQKSVSSSLACSEINSGHYHPMDTSSPSCEESTGKKKTVGSIASIQDAGAHEVISTTKKVASTMECSDTMASPFFFMEKMACSLQQSTNESMQLPVARFVAPTPILSRRLVEGDKSAQKKAGAQTSPKPLSLPKSQQSKNTARATSTNKEQTVDPRSESMQVARLVAPKPILSQRPVGGDKSAQKKAGAHSLVQDQQTSPKPSSLPKTQQSERTVRATSQIEASNLLEKPMERGESAESSRRNETDDLSKAVSAGQTWQSMPVDATKEGSTNEKEGTEIPRVSPNPSPPVPRKRSQQHCETAATAERESLPEVPGQRLAVLPAFKTSKPSNSGGTTKKPGVVRKQSLVTVCDQQIRKLQSLLDKMSTFPVRKRPMTATSITPFFLEERLRITSEHRAGQEYMAKRALRLTIAIVRSLKACPTRSALSESRTFLEGSLADFQLVVVRMLVCAHIDMFGLVA